MRHDRSILKWIKRDDEVWKTGLGGLVLFHFEVKICEEIQRRSKEKRREGENIFDPRQMSVPEKMGNVLFSKQRSRWKKFD